MYVATPPDFERLFRDVRGKRLVALLPVVARDGRTDDYTHWDKLRHLKPPGDLTAEEWWLAVKLGRSSQLEALPLKNASGQHFFYAVPSKAQRLLHFVDRHCSGEIAMGEVVTTDEQATHHYLVGSLMEEAIRSSQLEGAATSRRVAEELLRTGRPPRDRGERMIFNNYRALEFMREGMGDTLTPELVMTLQRILTEDTLDDAGAAGRLQTIDEERVVVLDMGDGSVIHTPPPADQLPGRLQAMCDFANGIDDDPKGFLHPVVRGILLHFWLAYDHPFIDGNGRTARALFYWYMRTHGYWLTEYLSISRILRKAPARYTKAFLLTETDGGDTTYFLLHQLDVIKRAVDQLHAYLQRKVREVKDVERMIKDAEALNHRQLALLSDAVHHPARSYTYQSHAGSHKVTAETARTDLLELYNRGLLERRRVRRKHIFSAVPDLASVLQRQSA